jgi:hypothetical protein
MATLGTVSINEGKILRLWFEVEQFRGPTQVSPGTSGPYTEDDKEGERFTTSSTGEQVTLVPVVTYSLNDDPISFAYSSDNPTEIDVAPDGQVVFMVAPESTASAIITIVSTSGTATTTRAVSVTLTLSGASVVDVIEGGVAGSARKALSDPMDTALSGANPATQQKVYTSQDHATPAYVRNTSFFLQGTHAEALTCTSPWNSRQAGNRAGTAVTARHAVLANHYALYVGDTLRFIASDNTVITRTVVQAARIFYSGNGNGTDAWMVLLDSDLPASITPCKLFPDGYETYLPAGATCAAACALPLLAMDFSENGIALDLIAKSTFAGSPTMTFGVPTIPHRLAFYDPLIIGDSGNPIFGVIGSELWLLSTFYSAGSGPFYGGLVTELNAMITTLDTLQGDITGHTVTVGDLSSYTTY